MGNIKDIKVDLKIGKYTVRPNLVKELEVSESGINRQMAEQASHFAYYAAMYALARNEQSRYASAFIAELRQFYDEKGTKYSETRLEKELEADDNYQQFKGAERVLKAIKEAFEQRKDMLISLASNLRAQGDLYIKERMATAADKGK